MILVDIQVPVLDRVYDFELDERRKVEDLLREIISLIEEKENLTSCGKKELYLYAIRLGSVLKRETELGAQGIKSGDRLILI